MPAQAPGVASAFVSNAFRVIEGCSNFSGVMHRQCANDHHMSSDLMPLL
jgi:hypothetical protein